MFKSQPLTIALALLFAPAINCAAQAAPGGGLTETAEEIRLRIETYRSTGQIWVGETALAAPGLLAELYEARQFAPLWDDDSNRRDLFDAIRRAPEQGFRTADYHLPELENRGLESGLPSTPTDAAAGDLLITDAVIRLVFHLRFGKVNPNALNADWNFEQEIRSQDPARALAEALEPGNLARELEGLPVQHPAYDRMKAALAEYRTIQDAGGWPRIGDGPTLHKGDRDSRVATLRTRLEATGDLQAGGVSGSVGVGGEDPTLFDDALEAAVRAFQYRHGLDVDGVVGSGTLEALNVPVEARVDQIRVNLERARWILLDLGQDFVAANIAAFEVHIVRDDTIAWTTRAQVGKTYRKTPLFRADLDYVVFNPTWTVPPTILAQDVLPAIQSDIGYLETKHMDVLTHDGRVVDPATVDWASHSGRDLPYIIRQRPGPWNALGQVKFIFPNPNFVFIHDTPSTSLFDRTVRTFSSGCVRIEDPLDFAVQVLGGSGQWNDQAVSDAVASQETQTVHLAEPLPVLLLYWTAEGGRDGLIHFREDVYDRDGVILQELDGPFDFWLDLARRGSPEG